MEAIQRINEQTKNILVLEKEPSSYVDESLEPSERTPQEYARKKKVKNISNLNQSFEEMDTKKKTEPADISNEAWNKKFKPNQPIGYGHQIFTFFVHIMNNSLKFVV